MKYSYFNNHEDQMSYTVIHAEDGTETFIAICDSAEKADFITKACNQFSLSPDPTPEVGKMDANKIYLEEIKKGAKCFTIDDCIKECTLAAIRAMERYANQQCEVKDAEYAEKEHSLRNELQGLLSKQAASMLDKFSEKDAEIKELREQIKRFKNPLEGFR